MKMKIQHFIDVHRCADTSEYTMVLYGTVYLTNDSWLMFSLFYHYLEKITRNEWGNGINPISVSTILVGDLPLSSSRECRFYRFIYDSYHVMSVASKC